MVNKHTGMCVKASREATDKSPFSLTMAPCDRSDALQKFVFQAEGFVVDDKNPRRGGGHHAGAPDHRV